MKNVLLLTSRREPQTVERLLAALGARGFAVASSDMECSSAHFAVALSECFAGCPPDVIVADLSKARDCLPLANARRVMRSVWGESQPPPLVIALLDLHHLEHPDWRAFVDDFLLPPFRPEEVVGRISLLLFQRRHVLTDNIIKLPGITIHLETGSVTDDRGESIMTTPREFDLLRFLAEHRGRLFPRERLLDLVWGVHFDGGERTVDIHVRRLRAKLPSQTAQLLRTRRGCGYGIDGDHAPHRER